MRVLGAVLAGGEARRFGSDKALAQVAGTALIDLAIAAVSPWVEAVVVCGRDHPGHNGLADRPGAGMGPLGGINAGLHHGRAHGFDAVLTIACDMPVLPQWLAVALLGGGARVVAGQPMLGCWPVTLAGRLDAHLVGSDDRSMRGWIDAVGAQVVPADGRALPNINTPADLASYRRAASDGRVDPDAQIVPRKDRDAHR